MDVTRETSENAEQGSGRCRPGLPCQTCWPTRNRVIFLLSIKAGLRAKEIARLTWRMVTDARGQVGQAIHLEDAASKGRSGRVIPMNEELRTALCEYAETIWMPTNTFLIRARGRAECRRKPSSTCSGDGTGTSASTAVRVIAADALSSPISRGRYQLLAGPSGMSRCWPVIRTFEPRSVTSKPTRKRRSGSSNSFSRPVPDAGFYPVKPFSRNQRSSAAIPDR